MNGSERKFEMTTPVLQISEVQKGLSEEQNWSVCFVMPKDLEFADLPHPEDESVRFVQWPSKTFAVYRYSGNIDDAAISEAREKLDKALVEGGKQAHPPYIIAQYDPPLAIPFFKRNELLIEIDSKSFPEHSYA